MSDYLRDCFIPFHTIGMDELESINDELQSILADASQTDGEDSPLVLQYTLRYDEMGVARLNFQEIKNCFQRAKNVERLVFEVKGPKWIRNQTGRHIFLKFDTNDHNGCYLCINDDSESWVDNVYKRLSQRLSQYKNNNALVRHQIVDTLIQIFGVVVIFLVCLLLATKFSPMLNLKDSFFVIFIAALLIFSNLWTYVLVLVKKFRDYYWPLVSFKRKPLGWLGQAIVAAVVIALLSFLAERTWQVLAEAGSAVIK